VEGGSLTIAGAQLTVAGTSEIIGSLNVQSGTLTGAGDITVSGSFSWTGGTLSGSGITTTTGATSISGTAAKGLLARRWDANGPVTWTGTGAVALSSGAVINNASTWDCQNDVVLIWGVGAAPAFNNSGTFKKSAGAGTTTVQVPFFNTGAVLIQTGSMIVNQGGSSSGSFDLGVSHTLQFAGGTFNLNGGTTFTGSGNILLNGTTLSVNASIDVPAAITVDMAAGIITGTGTLTTQGPLNFSGGTMQSTGVTTCNGALNISGTAVKGIQLGRTLNNNATANYTATGTGNLGVSTASVINNTGTWDFQGDGSVVWGVGTAPSFNNTGTLKKSAGTGTSFLQLPFVNDGTVLVQSGTLNSNQGGSSTGSFNIAAGTTLQWGGGTFNLNTGTTFTGLGTILLSAAGLNANDSIATPPTITFDMTGGTINGLGTLTTAGIFNWSAGTFNNAGTTNFDGPLNISGAGTKGVSTRILNNNLLATWTGTASIGMSFAAVINNHGTWECLNDAAMAWGVGSAPSFWNFGTFRKSVGVGTTSLLLPYRNQGTVDVQSGTISTNNYAQTAGTTRLTGGAFSSTATIAIQGGTLAGSGTVTGPVVVSGTGALAPGLSPGSLAITGTYTQQAGSTTGFNVEIGGLTPGTPYDRASVTGTTTLAGNLNVTLINGFVPLPGDSFTILTYPSRTGTYTLNLPSVGCIGWRIDYRATALVLTAEAVPQEIVALTMPNKTTLSWNAAAIYANTTYNVLRGDLDKLPVGLGADETCVVPSTTATTGTDAATPASGTGFWYVVRETVLGCGNGTYGFASSGAERISNACP